MQQLPLKRVLLSFQIVSQLRVKFSARTTPKLSSGLTYAPFVSSQSAFLPSQRLTLPSLSEPSKRRKCNGRIRVKIQRGAPVLAVMYKCGRPQPHNPLGWHAESHYVQHEQTGECKRSPYQGLPSPILRLADEV
jgi:hypothetical protein